MSKKTEQLHLIYQQYADSLYSYGCKFTDDKELVKDCIQDVFVNLHQKIERYSIQNIHFYLLRSLKNRLIQELSKNKTLRISEELPFTIPMQPSVEFSLVENEDAINTKLLVEKALNILTHRQREAVYLYYIEELDYDTICQLMNMNYQSVRNIIHRSITKLREHLSDKELIIILSYFHLSSLLF